jgi:primase-polymerase (primpol)-like protein
MKEVDLSHGEKKTLSRSTGKSGQKYDFSDLFGSLIYLVSINCV